MKRFPMRGPWQNDAVCAYNKPSLRKIVSLVQPVFPYWIISCFHFPSISKFFIYSLLHDKRALEQELNCWLNTSISETKAQLAQLKHSPSESSASISSREDSLMEVEAISGWLRNEVQVDEDTVKTVSFKHLKKIQITFYSLAL